jgi:hypothetical protein
VVGVAGSWAALGGSSPFLIRISNTSSTIWLFTFFGRELVLLLPELFVSASWKTKQDLKFKTVVYRCACLKLFTQFNMILCSQTNKQEVVIGIKEKDN